MSLTRTFLTICVLLGLALAVGPHTARRFPSFWREHRLKRFDAEASRSAAYPLDSTDWLEFDIPRQALGLRILTNAAVQDLRRRVTTREEPRDGWRYAIEYQLLTRDGQLLDSSEYHLRASVLKDWDPSTGAERSASWFGNSDWLPTMTRTVQLPFHAAPQSPDRLRVRLSRHETEVQEVTIRVFMQYERSDFDQPYVWSRLSPEARERLARPFVYPPTLLTVSERKNLVRWDWTALPPKGLEGQDYQTRWFYQATPEPEQREPESPSFSGLSCSPDQHLVLALPSETSRVRLELERLDASPRSTMREWNSQSRQNPQPPTEVAIQWYPNQPGPTRVFHTELLRDRNAFDLPVTGGWLEVRATDRIFCRASHSSSEGRHSSSEPLEHTGSPLRVFLAPPDQPLEYAITSFHNQPTPFCLVLRRLQTVHALTSEDDSTSHLPAARVEFRLLDAQGQELRHGELATCQQLSFYDRAAGTDLTGAVTESVSAYFVLDPRVRRVQVRATDASVAVAAFTRPMELVRTYRIPEDLQAVKSEECVDRTWFLLQPEDADSRLNNNLAVTVITQIRPPRRDPRIAAGDYFWEDFEPLGFWKGRHLFIPRDSNRAVRPEAITTTFCAVRSNRAVTIRLRPEADRPWIEPRLIYSTTSEAKDLVQIWLDDQLWHSFQPSAHRGELVLPPLPAERATTGHTLRVDAPRTLQVSFSHIEVEGAPLYTKRLTPQLENGRLRYQVTKRTDQAEGFILRPFFPRNWKQRARIHVRILDGPFAEGPFANLTLRSRVFDLLPLEDSTGLVLGTEDQAVDGGQRCFFQLAEDLPAGEYTLEVQLQDPQPVHVYAQLYRVIPGEQPQRDVELFETVIDPLGRSPSPNLAQSPPPPVKVAAQQGLKP